MGDRAYAYFTLGGHIETVDEIETLIEAIVDEGVRDLETQESVGDTARAKAFLRGHIEAKTQPSCDADEVNYGTFGEIEHAVSLIPGLGAFSAWESGGGFAAGQKTIMPDGTEYMADGNDAALVSANDLDTALRSDAPLEAVTELLREARKAEGSELPLFTVSPAVAAYLKIFAAKVA